MVANINIADLLFLNEQVVLGANPPPGGDVLSPLGIRAIEGSNNNITHQMIVDQYGRIVDTDTFGTVDQPFLRWVDTDTSPLALTPDQNFVYGPGNAMTAGFSQANLGNNPRTVSNLIADESAANPAVPADLTNAGDPGQGTLPFNTLMTFFGQFFDHGLDFVNKGGNGSVLIPILPGDPLYNSDPGAFNFMPLTRGTLDAQGELTNSTAPFVEQSQTYGSRASTTFYLMEYDVNGDATGDLVQGADGGMATWADIKANANMWAQAQAGADPATVMLTDAHVLNIPDPAMWDPAANGGLGEFAPGSETGQPFLADIAHNANPGGGLIADADSIINPNGFGAPPPAAGEYDNELLDAHRIAGDGRVNENVALTSIHHAFHEEHTRILEMVRDYVEQQDQIQSGFAAGWTGEMYFNAAKLINEMQYQHMVFEEFGRRISPNIDEFGSYNVEVNPIITAEFAHAVYRLGHSMLTDNVTAANAAGQVTTETLVDSFLNPVMFDETGAADFVKGAQMEAGHEIDEFVSGGLRNFLVGLSLDLAALNIARGREAGLGSLNQTRAELFAATGGDTALKPYESWTEFGNNLLNPGSLVNFVAAYSHDMAIDLARAENRLDDARTLAQDKIDNDAAFMGSGAGRDMGLEDIDLWMGGLAEAKVVVGGVTGMLGSTFDFVFANQMIAMQDGDRFYYLGRVGGNILDQIEGQTFSDILMRGTGATHMHGDAFGTPDSYHELSSLGQTDFTASDVTAEDHEVIGGTNDANIIRAGNGNDTVWGDGGDDEIHGGLADDHLYGGDGDDVIFGDDGVDFIRGDDGDDEIHGGTEDDAITGGKGNDVIFGDAGFDALLGGDGDDVIHGGTQDDEILGGEGHDLLFGDNGNDALDGEAGDDILIGGRGDDALVGGAGDDLLIGGQGADAMDGGVGGYDIASYETWNSTFATGTPGIQGLTIDLDDSALSTGHARGDSYLDIEELRGTQHNDIIFGSADPAAPDAIFGGAGNDTIDGRDGDDVISGQEGNDNINGGAGVDQVIFAGNRADYTIAPGTFGGLVVTEIAAPVGTNTDTLNGVEFLVFDDQIVNVSSGATAPLIFLDDTEARSQFGTDVDGAVMSDVIMDGDAINSATGRFISTIRIEDPDGIITSNVVTLAGADAAAFTLVNQPGGTQNLHFIGGGAGTNANFEAKPQYHVTVEVADNTGGGSALNLTLNIQDVNDNEARWTSGERANVQENTANGVVVYRAETDDNDTVGPDHTYTLSGPDAGLFNLVNGELRFNSAPDFEAANDIGGDNIYNVTIGAQDGPGRPIVTHDVAIHITDVDETLNTAPVAVDDMASTTQDVTVVITAAELLGNDTDANGHALSVANVVSGLGGTATLNLNGSVSFVPDTGYQGPASFTYQANDNQSLDNLSNVATVNVTVGPPVNTEAPVAVDDAPDAIIENQAAIFNVTGNDTDADGGPLTVTVLGALTAGDVTGLGVLSAGELATLQSYFSAAGSNVSFDPGAGLPGMESIIDRMNPGEVATIALTYTVEDQGGLSDQGVVTVTINGAKEFVIGTPMVDNLIGSAYQDHIVALGSDDTLIGGGGNDNLIGGEGADSMSGGTGDDIYSVDNVGDLVIEAVGEGIDTVYATSDFTLGANVETLIGVGSIAQELHGNAGSNAIYGGAFNSMLFGEGGDDALLGGSGDERLDGGTGADYMAGGAGNDTYVIDDIGDVIDETAGSGGSGIDTVEIESTYTLLSDFENLTLTGSGNFDGNGNALDNMITGNSGNNFLLGHDGADTLIGGAGNDILGGGAGIDTMIGGLGDDLYSVTESADVIVELAGEGTQDTVYAAVDYTLADNIENLILQNAGLTGTGNAMSNSMYGSAGDDRINGAGGADYLVGLGGNDTYIFVAGDSGVDYIALGFDGAGAAIGDSIELSGYGAGATLTEVDRNAGGAAYEVTDGTTTDYFVLLGTYELTTDDYLFV
ncbi:peroxidase family protein [Ahrensia sp. R2A130]|uniref:peroxidase family protein n=1 Tax=Ahrensia sp. R2A130 TaxID=744979 RepID=UPI0001E094AB|nr:peroxidase family protein [Ahrensia sp. R2A130]EFL88146.1 heme peroxidase [Ahrensia sp. R2A130]